MAKFRSYCVVIHNVRSDCKPIVLQHVSSAKRSAVGLEPYPDQDGFHVHIQVEYPNQRHFTAVLKDFEGLSRKIVSPRPDGEERSWGRVQVDQMRGTFEEATAYLTNPRKSKPVDGQVVVRDPKAAAEAFYHDLCPHGYKSLIGQLEDRLFRGVKPDKVGICQECEDLMNAKMLKFREGFKNSMLSQYK